MSFFQSQGHHAELMIDLETMGTKATAPVLTIGAVLFSPYETSSFDELRDRAFLRKIELASAIKHSGGIEPSTLAWWFGQKDEAIKALVGEDCVPLEKALIDLEMYIKNRTHASPLPPQYRHLPVPKKVWAKDPDFDCANLEDKFERIGRPYPFDFHFQRSVRTAQDLAFPNGPHDRPDFISTTGTLHDARDDAIAQALMIQACYMQLRLTHVSANAA